MPDIVIGREPELSAARSFLGELSRGPAALIFEGEPGIGKTTLWRTAGESARRLGFRVLSARPAQAEAKLAYTALADLLEPVAGELVRELPEPQRRALAVALLHEPPGPRRLDRRAVGAAATSVLRLLGNTGPVIVAVDDLQWLDLASARVLEFALRRVGELPVGLLGSERLGDGTLAESMMGLAHALPGGRVKRVELAPLEPDEVDVLIEARLGRSLPRRTLMRIQQLADGNPFFALEIARVVPNEEVLGAAVVVPDNLRVLVAERVELLPHRTREALLVAALLGSPTRELVALGTRGRPAERRRAIERAEAAGLISGEDGRVRFSHPLFAAAVSSSAHEAERRRAHRRLAAVVEEPEQRVRHLALAADGPTERIARMLVDAADRAARGGAPDAATELVEQALRLTPPELGVTRHARATKAAEYQLHAGEFRVARQLLEAALEGLPTGHARAEALRVLGELRYHEDSSPEGERLLVEALANADEDPRLVCPIELQLAFVRNTTGDHATAATHGARALAAAQSLEEPGLLAEALAVVAITSFLCGRGLDETTLDRPLELEDPDMAGPVFMRPTLIAGCLELYTGRLSRARVHLEEQRRRNRERGQEADLPFVSGTLAWAECLSGDLGSAASHVDEAVAAAIRVGSDTLRGLALGYVALVRSYMGDAAGVTSAAQRALPLVRGTGWEIGMLWAASGIALLALSRADHAAAVGALEPVAELVEQQGVAEPVKVFPLPDAIEGLIGTGALERAERLLQQWEEASVRLARGWALVCAARARALLLAARGEPQAAVAAAHQAVAQARQLEHRFELARSLLVAGQIERRLRHKRAASKAFGESLEIFESAGARVWADQTRRAIAALGLRRAAPADLTPGERRVAELAASGLRNREVASRLFMSPKTVEANLSRAYRKLGIHSRAELAARILSANRGAEQK